MLAHPSLTAAYSGPPALKARETMRRNELCWCGQGFKWKKCHAGREQLPPMNVFDVEDDARKRGKTGYCSHAFDGTSCSNIIKAHTVQRNGGLAAIAERKSRVLTVKPNLRAMIDHDGNPPPKEIGIGDASVFPGFCAAHDDAVFKPIEGTTIALTAPEALLFAYRAIAYERFTKAVHVGNAPVQRQMDRGAPLWMQEVIQQRCHLDEVGARRSLGEMEDTLATYRKRVEAGDTVGFHHRAYRFDTVLPIVACGGYMPEVSINGRQLQRLARGTAALEQLTLTVTSYRQQSVAVFGWIGPTNGASGTYVAAFDALSDAHKADALIQIAFEQLENIFLQISWWTNLPGPQQDNLTRRIRAGTGLTPHLPGCYRRSTPLLSTSVAMDSTHS